MSETPSPLASVDLVLAIARAGSATRAAKKLATTTATVLRRLESFEEAIGARLFDRLPSGLRPTPALALVKPWAEQAESAAVGMMRELSGLESRPVGTVRVAALPATAALFLIPAVPALRARYPDITLEIAPATAVVDLTLREADIAIRVVRPERGDLIVQRLAPVRMTVVRAPSLAVKRGAKLRDLPWLAYDRSLDHIPDSRWLATHVPDARIVLRSTELGSLLAAAQCGIGVLLVADIVAERAGGLVPVGIPVPPAEEGAVWIAAHAALKPVARVTAVWDWIVASLTPRPSLTVLESRRPRTKKLTRA